MQNEEIAHSLRTSLESTNDGLTKFLVSLRQAGLPDAVKGYRQLQMVLMQQRLWAQNHKRQELDSLFQSIARNAAELHAVFAAFAGIMEPLIDLPNLSEAAVESPNEPAKALATEAAKSLTEQAAVSEESKPSATKTKPIALPTGRKFQVIIELLMTHGSLTLRKLTQLANQAPEKGQKDVERLVEAGAISRTDGRSPRYQLSKRFIRQLLVISPAGK